MTFRCWYLASRILPDTFPAIFQQPSLNFNLVVASLASLGERLVSLESLLAEQHELFHIHHLEGQIQRGLQLLYLKNPKGSKMQTVGEVGTYRLGCRISMTS